MCLSRIPVELLSEILFLALHEHPCPSHVLRVDKSFLQFGQRILHSQLHFRTIRQLVLFLDQVAPLACPPKSITIDLAGGAADFDVFFHLAVAMRRCRCNVVGSCSEQPVQAPLPIELLSLRLHSHARSQKLEYIYEALKLVNPKTFIWLGPDPAHHFSTAIVPQATFYLFRAIRTWTNIQHITLSNLSFPSDDLGMHTPFRHKLPLLPVIPSLRTLCLGQATLLLPSSIAAMICLPGQDSLELVRLVDAYSESIWGPRIRRRDIEKAALALETGSQEEVIAKVRRLVKCEAMNERIMGGDRVEGPSILD
ncbi:hypothetical protein AcW1_002512 [Taiwanofungus camphoratus]|nr:hypothetical protein AcV5_009831 [Antrodia cinnamomea]KAI0943319.1 hypothetical protein AcW1_002512 [Antrodia cinnamomea]